MSVNKTGGFGGVFLEAGVLACVVQMFRVMDCRHSLGLEDGVTFLFSVMVIESSSCCLWSPGFYD